MVVLLNYMSRLEHKPYLHDTHAHTYIYIYIQPNVT